MTGLVAVLALELGLAVIGVALGVNVPCNHRLYAHIDEHGRIFQACRCGERCHP